ncbi:MAG: MtrAB system histidine kinase MtrB [Ornithinimicrobium sp.]
MAWATRPALAERAKAWATSGRVGRLLRSRSLTWWRSSLRLRVICTTVVLGMVLAALLGTLLYRQVASGLVEQAVGRAEADAAQRVQQAQELFDATDRRDDFGLSAAAIETVNQIGPGGHGEDRRALLVQALDSDRDTLIAPVTLGDLEVSDVPLSLREAVRETPELQQVLVSDTPLPTGGEQPAVSVVSRVQIPRAGPYDLVLVYPMDRERQILDLVREWFLIGGFGLLVLIAGLAWMATRLVTDPVGQAASVSQDLARGQLDERMEVSGTDELARLATSFNTMADSLQQQIQQLEELSLTQQRFVSDVSHELRTPLTTIRMAGDILYASREDFGGPIARSAELLHSELDRFEDLLSELLEISRYDSGTTVMDARSGDLVALTRGVVDSVAAIATTAGSEVRLWSEQPVQVEMDARRITRVLRNLLLNAVEHGEGKPIDVAFAEDEHFASVSVRDYGIGLSEEQIERVFERFWRADAARTRTTGGTGLGLSIAREDARLHHGTLRAAGRLGEGACFLLTLPKRSQEAEATAPLEGETHPSIEDLECRPTSDRRTAQAPS